MGTLLISAPWLEKEHSMSKMMGLIGIALALALSGCNTVKGVGQDIQKAGEKIEGAARK
jgi:predicted small secreted protein